MNINNTNVTAEMLELLPRMTPELAAAIIDWRDANEDVTSGGAEADTYARLEFILLLQERAVRFGGRTAARQWSDHGYSAWRRFESERVLDPNETDENRDGLADPGILEYLTVSSRRPNTRADSAARANINNRNELATVLGDALGSTRANDILRRLPAPTVSSELEFYRISGMTAAEFAQIETEITSPYRRGHRRSRECQHRERGGADLHSRHRRRQGSGAGELSPLNSSAVDSVAWVKEVLNQTRSNKAGPFLTGQSYQFTADIAAIGKFGRGYRRTRFVFDTTEGTPKIVYRQNLRNLGWALGRDTRETWLATATP